MSQVEVTQFNTQFTQYEGKQRGSVVKSLYQTVLSNNVSQDSDDRKVKIVCAITGNLEKNATSLPANMSRIATGSSYNIDIAYGSGKGNAGLVETITITQAQ